MSFQKTFKSILENQAFDQLNEYTEPGAWTKMSADDRELLAILFVKHGETKLIKGDKRALHCFELAEKIAPDSYTIYFTLACAFADREDNAYCLAEASKYFEKATELNPSHSAAWHSWANILMRLGSVHDQVSYFYLANEKFLKAEQLTKEKEDKAYFAILYWHWSTCWFHIAKHSGEVVDYTAALEKFRKAEAHGCDKDDYIKAYGIVLIELGQLLGRKELLEEAASYLKKYTQNVPERYEGWANLATCHKFLFDISNEPTNFFEADEAFSHAVKLNSNVPTIWFGWGQLYLNYAKIFRNFDKIKASLDKFEKAYNLERDSLVLLYWGEAQMISYSFQEDLDLLREAERKIRSALEGNKENPYAWFIYGNCLNELGFYFSDEDYFYKAIDQFREGLKISPNHPFLLHGLAVSHFSIGDMSDDIHMLERSIFYWTQLANTEGAFKPQFYSELGTAYMRLGEITNDKEHIEAAAEKFEQAINYCLIETNGEQVDVDWLFNYGCAMDQLGDFHEETSYYEKSIEVLAHVLKLEPAHPYARLRLALALFHLGELIQEVDCFHKAIDLFNEHLHNDPEDELAWNDYGLTLMNLAVLTKDPIHDETHRYLLEQAESKFHQSAALGNWYAYYNLACLYAIMNNTKASMHYLDKAESCEVLPPIADLMHDEWLSNIHNESIYRQFISRLINKKKDLPPHHE